MCTRRFCALCSLLLLAALLLPVTAHAHKVNVYGWLEGSSIQIESSFSNGAVPREALIWITDARTGDKLAEGRADADGRISFPVPEKTANGLLLHINAGEGHVSDFLMPAEEFASAAVVPADSTAAPATSEGAAGAASSGAQGGITAQEMQAIVNAALDAKLGPIRRQLAAQVNAGPRLQDIIGGIGWILGLAGMGLYFRSRRK